MKCVNKVLGSVETSYVSTNDQFMSRVLPLTKRAGTLATKTLPTLNSKYPGLLPAGVGIVAAIPVLLGKGKLPGLVAAVVVGGAVQGAMMVNESRGV